MATQKKAAKPTAKKPAPKKVVAIKPVKKEAPVKKQEPFSFDQTVPHPGGGSATSSSGFD